MICSIPVLLHDTLGTKLGFKISHPSGWDVIAENPNRVIFHSFSNATEYDQSKIKLDTIEKAIEEVGYKVVRKSKISCWRDF